MNLYLVQHGEAKTKQEDPERHLTEKGMEDVKNIANFIAKQTTLKVNAIIHSGKTRAQQTAKVFGEFLQPPKGVTEGADLKATNDPKIWAERLTEIDEDIMLVGHLPHLSKLSSLLIVQDDTKKVVDFKMAGVVCLNRDQKGEWSVSWMITPDILVP